MDLSTFTQQITTKFNSKVNYEARIADATKIAKKYRFNPPELVLFITHPEMSRMNLRQRCERLGVTEEYFMHLHGQEGFKRFIQDYKALNKDVIEVQTLENISAALATERYVFDDEGNRLGPDTRLEEKLYDAQLRASTPAASINVQVNNLWSQAREKIKGDSSSVAIPTTATTLPE